MLVEDRKKQIIQSAIETFGAYGYKKTSMQDIADALDISRPALYQYYKNKEAVFLALVEHTLQLGEQAAIKGFSCSEDNFTCLLRGVMDMEQVLFEPIFLKPNGKELFLLSKKLAPDLMADFEKMVVDKIIGILQKAQAQQQIDLSALQIEASDAAHIILLGMDGIKTSSLSLQMLAEQTKLFLTIFWKGLQ
jgi:AcrR family transcriptional regulator